MTVSETSQEITVLGGKVRLYQPQGGFRTSLDSVLLAHFCPARNDEKVLDAGCGVGGAALCLAYRLPRIHITGVEWAEDYLTLARANAMLNNVDQRSEWVLSDIRTFDTGTQNATKSGTKPQFHHVMMNPPFFESSSHTPSPDRLRAQALGHQSEDLQLEDWITAAHRLVKNFGSLTIIYPTGGVSRILQAFGPRWGGVEIIPIYPRMHPRLAACHAYDDQQYTQKYISKRVIIRARKNRKTPCAILPPLFLHDEEGNYTTEADRILKGEY